MDAQTPLSLSPRDARDSKAHTDDEMTGMATTSKSRAEMAVCERVTTRAMGCCCHRWLVTARRARFKRAKTTVAPTMIAAAAAAMTRVRELPVRGSDVGGAVTGGSAVTMYSTGLSVANCVSSRLQPHRPHNGTVIRRVWRRRRVARLAGSQS